MKYGIIVENNFDFIVRCFKDSWEYDSIMEDYINEYHREINVKDEQSFLYIKGKRDSYKLRNGTSRKIDGKSKLMYCTDFNNTVSSNNSDIMIYDILKEYLNKNSKASYCMNLYSIGYDTYEIGEKLNKTSNYVSAYLSKAREDINKLLGTNYKTHREVRKTIIRKENRMFNNKQVLKIRLLHKEGKTVSNISKIYNVNTTAISDIVNYKSYKEV